MVNLYLLKLKTALSYLFFLINIILLPFVVLILFLLKPLILIRFTLIRTNRFGHFTQAVEQYLLRKKIEPEDIRCLDLFYTSKYGICNKEFFKLAKKKMIILPNFLISHFDLFLNKIFKKKNCFII